MSEEYTWRYTFTGTVKHALGPVGTRITAHKLAVCGNSPIWFDHKGWRGDTPDEQIQLKKLRQCKKCCSILHLPAPKEENQLSPAQARRSARIYRALQSAKPGDVFVLSQENGSKVLLTVGKIPGPDPAFDFVANLENLVKDKADA